MPEFVEGAAAMKVDINDMTNEALWCRSDHHAWNHKGDTDIVTKRGYVTEFRRNSVCARCGADRSQLFEVPSFRIKKAHIYYPEGYLHDGGRLYVADVRREQLVRMGLKVKEVENGG